MSSHRPKVHVEEFTFDGVEVTLRTDCGFTNPRDMISLQVGDHMSLNSFQVDRLLGAFLRAVYFSVFGNGVPVDDLSKIHPGLAADTAQRLSAQMFTEIAQESSRRIMDDEGKLEAMILLQYKLLQKAGSRLVIPGKEDVPKIEAVIPEFTILPVKPMIS